MDEIDVYLDRLAPADADALRRIRAIVHEMVPEVTEKISYQIPTFCFRGKNLLHFGAFKGHLSLFPSGDPALEALGDSLNRFRKSKGTYQFTADDPIPESVIRQVIEVRLNSIG